jgi:hypothetical protein
VWVIVDVDNSGCVWEEEARWPLKGAFYLLRLIASAMTMTRAAGM